MNLMSCPIIQCEIAGFLDSKEISIGGDESELILKSGGGNPEIIFTKADILKGESATLTLIFGREFIK